MKQIGGPAPCLRIKLVFNSLSLREKKINKKKPKQTTSVSPQEALLKFSGWPWRDQAFCFVPMISLSCWRTGKDGDGTHRLASCTAVGQLPSSHSGTVSSTGRTPELWFTPLDFTDTNASGQSDSLYSAKQPQVQILTPGLVFNQVGGQTRHAVCLNGP